jgi:hypothetical protein
VPLPHRPPVRLKLLDELKRRNAVLDHGGAYELPLLDLQALTRRQLTHGTQAPSMSFKFLAKLYL